MTPNILHECGHYVAVHKPAGLLVHRTPLDSGTNEAALQAVRDVVGQPVFPVHRLDKPTSGLLVFGRSPEAAAALSRLFAGQRVEKEYRALVRGWMTDSGRIDHPLSPVRSHRRVRGSAPAQATGRPAATRYELCERFEVPEPTGRYATTRASLVTFRPETGRTHQVRRHAKHVFHPVIGDRKYGDDAHSRFHAARFGVDRLMLACVGLSFEHPFTGGRLSLRAEPDRSFMLLLDALAPWRMSGA